MDELKDEYYEAAEEATVILDAVFTAIQDDLEAQGETARVKVTNTDDIAAAKDDDKTIDSVTIGAATSLGPVKFQLAYVDENGSEATGDKSPNLLSLGFRVPLGSAEIRGHMTEVDPDDSMRDDDEAWGLLVMNDFGGGYFGMIGVGNYTDGARVKMGTDAVIGGMYATKTRTGTSDDTDTEADESRADANTLLIRTNTGTDATPEVPVYEYRDANTGVLVVVEDDATNTADAVSEDDIENRDYVAERAHYRIRPYSI